MSNSRMLEIAPPSVGATREGRSNSWSLQLCLYCFFSFLCCVENNDCGQPCKNACSYLASSLASYVSINKCCLHCVSLSVVKALAGVA